MHIFPDEIMKGLRSRRKSMSKERAKANGLRMVLRVLNRQKVSEEQTQKREQGESESERIANAFEGDE